jgi:hypothetical protein
LSTVAPGLPAALERIVSKLLAKDLNARYQSAATLAADLRRVASELEGRWEEPHTAPRADRPFGGFVAMILMLGLVVMGVLWWYFTRNAP